MTIRCVASMLLTLLAAQEVSGTSCYSCQYTYSGHRVGIECVDNPEDYSLGPTTVECPGQCQTEKQVTEATKDVYFMRRGCAVRPIGCQTDWHGVRTTCIQSCEGDLCRTEVSGRPTNRTKTKDLEYGKINSVEQYRCYSCQYSYHPNGYDACVTDPSEMVPNRFVWCGQSNTVCRLFRQKDKAEGVVRSFYRGCEPRRGRKDDCVESVPFIDCDFFCESDLCNHGNGLQSTPSMAGKVSATTMANNVAPRTTRRTRRLRPTQRAAEGKLRSSGKSLHDAASALLSLVVVGYVAML